MKFKIFNHTVPDRLDQKVRLSTYLIGEVPYLETGQSVKKAIKRGQIFLNGSLGYSGDWVHGGDYIEFKMDYSEPVSVDVAYEVVYVDEHIIIVNKPPGVVSSGNVKTSLQNALKMYPESAEEGSLLYPHLVHRLDGPTCGLIIGARTIHARRQIGAMIENRELVKHYALIAEGHIDTNTKHLKSVINEKIAHTELLEVDHLETKDPTSFVRVRLHTGRTHQIRIHFQEISHPIVGDTIYNREGLAFGRGLFLIADKLMFDHPITQKPLDIKIDLHKKFDKYILK